mmetsp:Transcript_20931/g.54560  ORF Transcript_20931/g.54560 Transcript_20931/m.54560 type:complete len:316 (-) Transcript_20931:261-1208(-)
MRCFRSLVMVRSAALVMLTRSRSSTLQFSDFSWRARRCFRMEYSGSSASCTPGVLQLESRPSACSWPRQAHSAPQAAEVSGRLGRLILPTPPSLSMAMWGKLKKTYCSLPPSTGEWLRPALMPMTPQVSTPPRPWVEKQEPNTLSILSSRIMQDSSRHRLLMAMVLLPVKPLSARATSTRFMKSSTARALGKLFLTSAALCSMDSTPGAGCSEAEAGVCTPTAPRAVLPMVSRAWVSCCSCICWAAMRACSSATSTGFSTVPFWEGEDTLAACGAAGFTSWPLAGVGFLLNAEPLALKTLGLRRDTPEQQGHPGA